MQRNLRTMFLRCYMQQSLVKILISLSDAIAPPNGTTCSVYYTPQDSSQCHRWIQMLLGGGKLFTRRLVGLESVCFDVSNTTCFGI